MKRLLELAASGSLPGYPMNDTKDTFFGESPADMDTDLYFSGENDALERQLEALWAHDGQMKQCIPILLAAVEKSRGQEEYSVAHSELYNYTM